MEGNSKGRGSLYVVNEIIRFLIGERDLDKIEIKCPKCRYRFEWQATPGENEIACACPRCGFPFTYHIPTAEEVSASIVNKDMNGNRGSATGDTGNTFSAASPHGMGEHRNPEIAANPSKNRWKDGIDARTNDSARREKIGERFENPLLNGVQKSSNDVKTSANSKGGHGCFFKFLFSLLCIFSLLIFGIRGCMHFINADDEEQEVIEGIEQDEDEDRPANGISALHSSDITGRERQPTPSWVKGEWEYDTHVYGRITLKIDDKELVEKIDGMVSRGTYFCSNDSLFCKFPKEEGLIAYRLDLNAEVIDAGDGMLMTKIQ